MTSSSNTTARERRLSDALDRIARFAEAYERATEERAHKGENVGGALCVTLGHYARRTRDGEIEELKPRRKSGKPCPICDETYCSVWGVETGFHTVRARELKNG